MSRSRLAWLAAVSLSLAAGASGCALCDECHKIPVPCNGPGCSAALSVDPSSYPGAMSGPVLSPAAGAASPMTINSSGGAAAANGSNTPNGSVPSFVPPPLPEVPNDPPASPPTGPAAPEKP
jgi:hypothetical protein